MPKSKKSAPQQEVMIELAEIKSDTEVTAQEEKKSETTVTAPKEPPKNAPKEPETHVTTLEEFLKENPDEPETHVTTLEEFLKENPDEPETHVTTLEEFLKENPDEPKESPQEEKQEKKGEELSGAEKKLREKSDKALQDEIEEEEKKRKEAENYKPPKPGALGTAADFILSTFFGVRLPAAERYENYKNGDWKPPEYDDSHFKKLLQERERRAQEKENRKEETRSTETKETQNLLKQILESKQNPAKEQTKPESKTENGVSKEAKKGSPEKQTKEPERKPAEKKTDAPRKDIPELKEGESHAFVKQKESLEARFGKLTDIGHKNLQTIWNAKARTKDSNQFDERFFAGNVVQDWIDDMADGKGDPEQNKEFFRMLNSDEGLGQFALDEAADTKEAREFAAANREAPQETQKKSKPIVEERKESVLPKIAEDAAPKNQLENHLGQKGITEEKVRVNASIADHLMTDMDSISEDGELFEEQAEQFEKKFGELSEIGRANLKIIWDANEKAKKSGMPGREYFGSQMAQNSVTDLLNSDKTPDDMDMFHELNSDPDFGKDLLKFCSRTKEARTAAENARVDDTGIVGEFFEGIDEQESEAQKAPIEADEKTKMSSLKQAEKAVEKTLEDIYHKLEVLFGKEAINDTVRKNVNRLYDGNQEANEHLEQKKTENKENPKAEFSLERQDVGNIIAFNQFTSRLDNGDAGLLNALNHSKFAGKLQKYGGLTKDSRYMAKPHTAEQYDEAFNGKTAEDMVQHFNKFIDKKINKAYGVNPSMNELNNKFLEGQLQYGNNLYRVSGDLYFNAIPGREQEAERDKKALVDRSTYLHKKELKETLTKEERSKMSQDLQSKLNQVLDSDMDAQKNPQKQQESIQNQI